MIIVNKQLNPHILRQLPHLIGRYPDDSPTAGIVVE